MWYSDRTGGAHMHMSVCAICTKSVRLFSKIISTKSPSFCMKTFGACLTNLTALLLQSHDCSCHVSRPILTSPRFRQEKDPHLRAHDFAFIPDL